jgi:hypothetical protein
LAIIQSSNHSNYIAIDAAVPTAAMRDRDAAYPASKKQKENMAILHLTKRIDTK